MALGIQKKRNLGVRNRDRSEAPKRLPTSPRKDVEAVEGSDPVTNNNNSVTQPVTDPVTNNNNSVTQPVTDPVTNNNNSVTQPVTDPVTNNNNSVTQPVTDPVTNNNNSVTQPVTDPVTNNDNSVTQPVTDPVTNNDNSVTQPVTDPVTNNPLAEVQVPEKKKIQAPSKKRKKKSEFRSAKDTQIFFMGLSGNRKKLLEMIIKNIDAESKETPILKHDSICEQLGMDKGVLKTTAARLASQGAITREGFSRIGGSIYTVDSAVLKYVEEKKEESQTI